MAAPTIVPGVFIPGNTHANLVYGYNAGFGHSETITVGSGAFRLIQSTANPDEWYVTAFAGSSPVYTDPKPTLATKAVGAPATLYNMRGHYYRPTFTATDLTNLVDAGDRTQTGLTGSATIVESTVATLEPESHYEITADLSWPGSGTLEIEIQDQSGNVIFQSGQFNQTDSSFSLAVHSGDFTAFRIRFVAGGSTVDVSNISIAQATIQHAGYAPLRPGTLGSLPIYGYAVGDNDSLGYDTFYFRLGGETPVDESLVLVFDTSDPGDGCKFKDLTIQWWLDPDLSTGIAAWPDWMRRYTEPRFRGTSREGELVDLAGRVPSSTLGSPIQGNSRNYYFSAGAFAPRLMVTNLAGESTIYEFPTVTVTADTRTVVEVKADGTGDYTTLAAAVTAEGTGDNKVFEIAGGHDETLSARIQSAGDYWAIRWNRLGARPIIRFDPAPSGNFDAFRITNGHDWASITGLAFHTLGVTAGQNPIEVCVDVLAARGWGLLDCTLNPLSDNPEFNAEGFAGTSNVSANNTRRCEVGLIQNVSAPLGIDGYFYACSNSLYWEKMVNIVGCRVGPSVQESCIRLTNSNTQFVVLGCDLTEDEKDVLRLVTGEVISVYGNRYDGANRNGASSDGLGIVRGIRSEANVTIRTQPASLGCVTFNPGVYDSAFVSHAIRLQHNAAAFGGDSAPGFAGVDSCYTGSRGIYDNDVLCATVVVEAGSLTTGSAISGSGSTNAEHIADQIIQGCVFSDESDGAWSGATITANASTATNNGTKADLSMSEFFVTATPQTGTRPAGVVYDLWANKIGASTSLGAAIAAPTTGEEPEPEPEPVISRGTRKARAVRAVRMIR